MTPHPLHELAIEITQIYRTGINVTRVIFEQDGDLEWERQMLLRYIDRHGPLTVTQMARRHKVTRQRISSLVQQLVEIGLFELQPHPKHRQSKLINLSKKGREYIQEADERMHRFFKILEHEEGLHVNEEIVLECINRLKNIRGYFDSRTWEDAAKRVPPS